MSNPSVSRPRLDDVLRRVRPQPCPDDGVPWGVGNKVSAPAGPNHPDGGHPKGVLKML